MQPTLASDAEILQQIEAFCATSGMGVTTFGRASIGDPNLVAGLRNGRSLTLKTAGVITAFIAAETAAPLEQRTHGAESAVDDEIADRVIICAVCDEPSPDPTVRACGNTDCPHALSLACAPAGEDVAADITFPAASERPAPKKAA